MFPSCLPVFQFSSSCISLTLNLKPSLLSGCEAGLIVSGYWCPCLPLRVFRHVSPTLASGVRLSDSHHFFAYHLSPDSSVSQLMHLQSSISNLPYSGGVWFFPCFSQSVEDICLPMRLSPVVTVSCSCFITISYVIGSYLCYFLPLCLLFVSGATQHRPPDSSNMKKVPCDSCCPRLRCTKTCQHQELVSPQTCTHTMQWIWNKCSGSTGV